MPKTATEPKRINLLVPGEIYDQLEEVANQRHTNIPGLLRQFIRLGLLAAKLEDDPENALLVRERGVERRVIFT